MKKIPGYRSVTPAERRRLRNELRQMWSTVPPHALARARELAGVQSGKEQEFRIALVKEEEGTQFIDSRVPINLRVWLTHGIVNGEDAKLLKVQMQCGDRSWQMDDGVYAKRFQSNEQLTEWLSSIEKHVLQHLSERLRDTCIYVWDEAIAKASHDHGVRKIDLTALAKSHIEELKSEKRNALSIRPGAKKGSKHSKVKISAQRLRVELPKVIRELGDPTRDQAAKRLGLKNGKALYRLLRGYGDKRRWTRIKADAWAKQ